MTASMFATNSLRGTLLVALAASVAFTSAAFAGVNQTACLSRASQALHHQAYHDRQVRRPGPGLLGFVRQITNAELAISSSISTPKPIAQAPKTDQGQLSDRALRERIARYRVSPTAAVRHASLATDSQAFCSD